MYSLSSDSINVKVLEDNIYQYNLNESIDIIPLIENTNASFITDWSVWSASDEYIFGSQKRLDLDNPNDQENELKQRLINLSDFIKLAAKDYSQKKNIEIGYLTPLTISKYDVDKTMGYHVDSYGDADPEPTISVVLYLNDNYEGGELHFREFDIKIKPEPYTLVIFPSKEPYYHSSLPLIAGTKYLMPGFFYRRKND